MWAPQIRELWRRVAKDCGWEHHRAPALRWLRKEDAVGAVVDFLEKTRLGSRASSETARARADENRGGEGPQERRVGKTVQARPRLYLSFVFPFLSFLLSPF